MRMRRPEESPYLPEMTQQENNKQHDQCGIEHTAEDIHDTAGIGFATEYMPCVAEGKSQLVTPPHPGGRVLDGESLKEIFDHIV